MTAAAEIPPPEQLTTQAERTYRAYLAGVHGVTFESTLNATLQAVEQHVAAQNLQSWRRLGHGALILQDGLWYGHDADDASRLEAEVQYSIGQAADDQAEFFADVRKARGYYVYEPSKHPIVWGRPTIMHVDNNVESRQLLDRVFEGSQVYLSSFLSHHVRFEPAEDQPNLP